MSDHDSDADAPEDITEVDREMSDHDSDSDAPEELTAQEGTTKDEEIRKIQRENEVRVAWEGKERRRQWAQRKAPPKLDDDVQRKEPPTSADDLDQEFTDKEEPQEGAIISGMLPSNIVDLLAACEKKTFASDSEEEIVNHKPNKKKKKQKLSGPETVLLKEIPPAQCQQNAIEFLKRRKMRVPRSFSVLKNSKQALRLLSSRESLSSTR
ncbi:uncharacterized protein A4U43_C05F32820 [Asparagus officinalis]|uniref:Uncharacterized protein n=1 Tax=Asparagus officinalis TaxID=4686 RepID=A0A5P1F1P2_ASPOF|nr:uncharacterized protein LOC109841146 [Asparagus officinalis]ONK70350.1 uncharacterized protein A4U43_C05F32820 [Asparagus officinalis]